MRPTTPELIASIVTALEQQVAPHVHDKWAASTLRSAAQLLNHLAVRTEQEGRVLAEDNLDAHRILESIAPQLAQPALVELGQAVHRALNAPQPGTTDVAAIDARNEIYQTAIERLVRQRELLFAQVGSSVHEQIRGYLRRRLQRERHLYFPAFTGPPF